VLSNLIDVGAVAGWRAESSIAALDAGRPFVSGATVLRGTDGALGGPRPRAARGSLMPGRHQTPGQPSASSRQDTRNKYQHATRAAALGGSATGSHPASWDPV
jgi:hypothetical protein